VIYVLALVLATFCGPAVPDPLPPLAAATSGNVRAVRALIDAGRRKAARTKWVSFTGWVPASSETAYGPADAAFTAGHYRTAFRLYEQLLFCGPASELDPQAYDTGSADLLRRALQRAGAGQAVSARQFLRSAAARDPASIESRYFLGLLEFVRGDSRAARAAWKAAIDDDGYAQPPDGWMMPRAQQAALERFLQAP
jgi:hypothetical protein